MRLAGLRRVRVLVLAGYLVVVDSISGDRFGVWTCHDVVSRGLDEADLALQTGYETLSVQDRSPQSYFGLDIVESHGLTTLGDSRYRLCKARQSSSCGGFHDFCRVTVTD